MRTRTFTVFVSASRAEVWRALTEPGYTRRFFFGLEVEAEWVVGGRITFRVPGGGPGPGLRGHLVLFDRHRTLMHDIDESSWVTWELAPAVPGVCRVSLTHDTLDPAAAVDTDEGWARLLSDLKTVLETGRPVSL